MRSPIEDAANQNICTLKETTGNDELFDQRQKPKVVKAYCDGLRFAPESLIPEPGSLE